VSFYPFSFSVLALAELVWM